MFESTGAIVPIAATSAATGAVLFIRKNSSSTEEDLRRFFEGKGYRIVDCVNAPKNSDVISPEVERLIQARTTGGLDFGVLAAKTITDITINEDEYISLRDRCKQAGIRIETMREGLVSEDELNHEHAVARIRFCVAKMSLLRASSYSRILSNKARSCPQGRPPIGYMAGKTEEGHPTLFPVKDLIPVIKELFKNAGQGATLTELTIEAVNSGLRLPSGLPLSKTQVIKLLRNPTYAGLLHAKDAFGVYLPGNFTSIVDMDLFLLVQEKLDGLQKGKKPKGSEEAAE